MSKKLLFVFCFLSLILFSACSTDSDSQKATDTEETSAKNGTASVSAAETTEVSGEISFDDVCAADIDIEKNWCDVGGRNKRAFAVTNREEFLSLYTENLLSQDAVLKKASEYFTDGFFEKYTVIVVFPQYGEENFYTFAESITKENGVMKINLRYCVLMFYMIEPYYFRSTLIILPKTEYQGENITVVPVNAADMDTNGWNEAVSEGLAFNSKEDYETALNAKLSKDLATLEKYKP